MLMLPMLLLSLLGLPNAADLGRIDVRSPEFAAGVGLALSQARRTAGVRFRHLADMNLPKATLKAAERGELQLNRPLLIQLASRYGVDLGDLVGTRDRLRIGVSSVAVGDLVEACETGSLSSMLSAYLRVVDRARSMHTTGPRPLRRDDIAQLADHLDEPCTTIIGRIGDLIEAKGAETQAMIDLYLTGASVVGLHGAVRAN